ncbi:MAG: nuclear transport factor 2 family protein [Polyangiaceae bacterium]
MTLLERALAYLSAIQSRGDVASHFCPDVEQRELPNQLVRNGATRDLAALAEAGDKGKRALISEQYEVLSAVEQGDRLALEAVWTATLAVPLGSIPAGGTLRAHLGMFFTFRDGRISKLHNYDCFEPF